MPKANEGVSEETLLAKAEAEAVAALPDWMHKLVAVSDGASISLLPTETSASNGKFPSLRFHIKAIQRKFL
jgi:hypothetical protein